MISEERLNPHGRTGAEQARKRKLLVVGCWRCIPQSLTPVFLWKYIWKSNRSIDVFADSLGVQSDALLELCE